MILSRHPGTSRSLRLKEEHCIALPIPRRIHEVCPYGAFYSVADAAQRPRSHRLQVQRHLSNNRWRASGHGELRRQMRAIRPQIHTRIAKDCGILTFEDSPGFVARTQPKEIAIYFGDGESKRS